MRHRAVKISDFDTCGQKVCFCDKNEAWKEAVRRSEESYGNVTTRPYRCKRCKGWHLTSFDNY